MDSSVVVETKPKAVERICHVDLGKFLELLAIIFVHNIYNADFVLLGKYSALGQ
jgi:hypothetical protein